MQQLLNVIRYVLRGLWAPLPLPSHPRWYDHLANWSYRLRGLTGGVVIVLLPPGLSYLIYENFTRKPLATLGIAILVGSAWMFAVTMAYLAGKRSTIHQA